MVGSWCLSGGGGGWLFSDAAAGSANFSEFTNVALVLDWSGRPTNYQLFF